MSHKLKLVYWDQIRGLCQHLRLVLELAEADYEEEKRPMSDSVTDNWESWLKEKFTLGMDFPNMPHLVDGDVKIAESVVIMQYLARKFGLEPESEDQKTKAEIATLHINDMRMMFHDMCFCSGFEKNKVNFEFEMSFKLPPLNNFLGEKPWFFGDKVTYVDCFAYEVMEMIYLFMPHLFKEFPKLMDFMRRFEKIPQIEKYMSSERFSRWPIFVEPPFHFGFHDPPTHLFQK